MAVMGTSERPGTLLPRTAGPRPVGNGRPGTWLDGMAQVRSVDHAGRTMPVPHSGLHGGLISLLERPLHLRLPTLLVLTAPVGQRLLVVKDVPCLGVAAERSAGAVSDVAQVTQQRALVALFDFAIQLGAVANSINEVGDVDRLAVRAVVLPNRLALGIVDAVAAAADGQAALVADEHHVGNAVVR